MKKIFVSLVVVMVLLTAFAVAQEALDDNKKAELGNKVDAVASKEIAGVTKQYVEKFAEKKGIDADKINRIEQVDLKTLPEDIEIENVDDSNIAIYEVNYTDKVSEAGNETRKLFVVTYSAGELIEEGDLLVVQDKRQFLNFGSEGVISDGFLKTATGVTGSLEAGYVMLRSGGITGVSTNLNVVNGVSDGNVEIVIYKNGNAISFGNTLDASSSGVEKDYDIQSKNIVTFEPGDVISVRIVSDDGVSVESVITMVEITTVG